MSLHVWKLCFINVKVQHEDNGHRAVIPVSPLIADDVGRTEKVTPWSILNWFTVTRFAVLNRPCDKTGLTFLEYDKMTTDLFTFFMCTRMTVSDKLYGLFDGSVPTSQPPSFQIAYHVGHIGASTISIVGVMKCRDTGEELARNTNQVALISKQTRKLVLVPDDWAKKYSPAVVENQRLVVASEAVPTDDQKRLARYELRIRWNDTDMYKHTNYLSYVKFCFDAAQQAVSEGVYSAFSGDILNYGVKEVEMLYKAESRANDELTIVSWQDDQNPYKIHFSMHHKSNKALVFQSRVEFYPLSGGAPHTNGVLEVKSSSSTLLEYRF